MVFNVSLQENMSSIPGRPSNGKLYCSIFDKLKFDVWYRDIVVVTRQLTFDQENVHFIIPCVLIHALVYFAVKL